MLVPKRYKPVDKAVLLFDGSPSSVHTIRMFSYLYPVNETLPVGSDLGKGMGRDKHLPDGSLMKNSSVTIFPKAGYKVLKRTPRDRDRKIPGNREETTAGGTGRLPPGNRIPLVQGQHGR